MTGREKAILCRRVWPKKFTIIVLNPKRSIDEYHSQVRYKWIKAHRPLFHLYHAGTLNKNMNILVYSLLLKLHRPYFLKFTFLLFLGVY